MKQFSFPQDARVRKSGEFRQLKEEGKVFKTRKLVFNYMPEQKSRLGVIVTKKVGKAVFRNKVRRWIKETFRQHQHEFSRPVTIIIIPRTSELSFSEISGDFSYFARWYNARNSD